MLGYNNSEDKGNWNEEQQVSTSVELPFAAQPESVYMGSSASEKGIVSNQNTSMKGNILLVFCSLLSTYSLFIVVHVYYDTRRHSHEGFISTTSVFK